MSLRSLLLAGTMMPLALTGGSVAAAAPERVERMQVAQAQPAERNADQDRRRGEQPRRDDERPPPPHRERGEAGPGANRAPERPAERDARPARDQSGPGRAEERTPPARSERADPNPAPAAAPERPMERAEPRTAPTANPPPSVDRDPRPARVPDEQRRAEPDRSAPGRPDTGRPDTGRPAADRPAADRPAADRPAADRQTERPERDARERPRDGEAPQRPQAPPERPTATPQRPPAPPTVAAPSPAAPPAATADELRARRMDDIRSTRREVREGDRTVIRESGRTIIREGDRTTVRHNEVDRFRAGARDVTTRQRGSETVTTVVRPGGARVVNVVDAEGRLIRRSRLDKGGKEVVLIDNRRAFAPDRRRIDLPPPVVRIPRERYIVAAAAAPAALLYETLTAAPVERIERAYALDEIRYTAPLRDRMPRIDLDTITFETGSWAVPPDQLDRLEAIAAAMRRAIRANPSEIYLIEGHTDAVGSDIDNLSLSDRRAESVAMALSERYQVPAENLTTQGYGEEFLKVQTDGPERANRRVAVRRITPLLTGRGGPPRG